MKKRSPLTGLAICSCPPYRPYSYRHHKFRRFNHHFKPLLGWCWVNLLKKGHSSQTPLIRGYSILFWSPYDHESFRWLRVRFYVLVFLKTYLSHRTSSPTKENTSKIRWARLALEQNISAFCLLTKDISKIPALLRHRLRAIYPPVRHTYQCNTHECRCGS